MMGKSAPEFAAQTAQHLERFRRQWRPTDAAALAGVQLGFEARQVGAGVGRYYTIEGTVERVAAQRAAQSAQLVRVQVRRDLHQQGHAPAVTRLEALAFLLQGFDDAGERRCRLQLAQSLGIR